MRFLLCVLAVVLTVSCKSKEERLLPKPVHHTPLPLDPLEDYELSRWWTNGSYLLRLDEDALYELFEGLNRYHTPIERGRWSQQSYAVMWLEPYGGLKNQRIRVRITKMNGDLALEIPKLSAMVAIAEPPVVMEDRLINEWHGEMGLLVLRSNLRYTFTPSQQFGKKKVSLAGHNGSWSVTDKTLLLHPDAPGIEPIRMQIDESGDHAILQGSAGKFSSSPTEE